MMDFVIATRRLDFENGLRMGVQMVLRSGLQSNRTNRKQILLGAFK